MNNTMCLGLFMIVIHAQGLEWTFTSETLTILLVTLLVGTLGASGVTCKAGPARCCWPRSISISISEGYVNV